VIDAEAGRLEVTAQHYPNLLKIIEPIGVLHSGFYCLTKEDCLLSSNTNIIVHSGFQSAQSFCNSMSLICSFESNVTAIARLLEKNITQSILSSTMGADKILCAMQTDTIYFRNEPSLARFSFHFVYKGHASLVPQLEASMRQLKIKGSLPKLGANAIQINSSCNKNIIAV